MIFCAHRREIAATTSDGKPGLQCASCFRVRPHPWNQTPEQARSWSRRLRKAKKGSVVYAREILEAGRKKK